MSAAAICWRCTSCDGKSSFVCSDRVLVMWFRASGWRIAAIEFADISASNRRPRLFATHGKESSQGLDA